MKHLDKKRVKTLERILFSLGLQEEKADLEIGDEWQAGVISHIRRLGPPAMRPVVNATALLNRAVWRFAAVACFISLILAVYVFTQGFLPEQELVTTFMDDPDSFMISQL